MNRIQKAAPAVMGYVMPYAYLQLARAVMMSDRAFGITPVQDIQLDRSGT